MSSWYRKVTLLLCFLQYFWGLFAFWVCMFLESDLDRRTTHPKFDPSRNLNPGLLDHKRHISCHRDTRLNHWAIRDLSQTSQLAPGVGTQLLYTVTFPWALQAGYANHNSVGFHSTRYPFLSGEQQQHGMESLPNTTLTIKSQWMYCNLLN